MIKLSKSSLSIKEKLAVSNVLDREFLGMGQEVQEFEKNLTKKENATENFTSNFSLLSMEDVLFKIKNK